MIRETLATEGGRLASVASIAERNAWLADNRPDLIITDVVLPDGDGIDSLPGVGVDPLTPVIVLSAQNTLDTAVRATGIGSYDYLPKLVDPRPDGSRVGKEWVGTCYSWWWAYQKKKKKNKS